MCFTVKWHVSLWSAYQPIQQHNISNMVFHEWGSKFYFSLLEQQKGMSEPKCLFVELLGMLLSVFPLTQFRISYLLPGSIPTLQQVSNSCWTSVLSAFRQQCARRILINPSNIYIPFCLQKGHMISDADCHPLSKILV